MRASPLENQSCCNGLNLVPSVKKRWKITSIWNHSSYPNRSLHSNEIMLLLNQRKMWFIRTITLFIHNGAFNRNYWVLISFFWRKGKKKNRRWHHVDFSGDDDDVEACRHKNGRLFSSSYQFPVYVCLIFSFSICENVSITQFVLPEKGTFGNTAFIDPS